VVAAQPCSTNSLRAAWAISVLVACACRVRRRECGGLVATWHAAIGFLAAALQFTAATLTPLIIEDDGPLGLIGLSGWLLWTVWIVAYGIALLRTAADR
jgi:hypothetical protein